MIADNVDSNANLVIETQIYRTTVDQVTKILTNKEGKSPNTTLAITTIVVVLLLFSIAADMYCLQSAQAQPSPWPSIATFWAPVTGVGASAQPEFTGCYAEVLIVYMRERPSVPLSQSAIVVTKDHDVCALLQTAYTTGDQGKFIGKLRSDLPLPARDVGGIGSLYYDIMSICIRC